MKTDWSNIQPRLGFAWSPAASATTVLRGGYGIYHDVSAMGGSTGPYQNPPYANAYSFTSDNITPVRTLATGFPDNSQPVDPANYRGDWTTIDPNFKQGRIQQWSLNVERSCRSAPSAASPTPAPTPTACSTRAATSTPRTPGPGFNPAARRPYPQLQAVIAALSRGWMKYNSLQMRLERARVNGLYLLGAYTYRQGDHQRRVRLRRRPRHRLLPGRRPRRCRRRVGQHRPAPQFHAQRAVPAAVATAAYLGRKSAEAVLGEWSVNIIFVAHSGYPLGMSMSNNQSGTAFGNRPDRVCDGKLDDPTVQRWFDTSCFVAPAVGVLGNAARTTLFGPGRWNVDMALSKRFGGFQFRAEIFNVFNNAQFAAPGTVVGSPTFGDDHVDGEGLTAGPVRTEVRVLTDIFEP